MDFFENPFTSLQISIFNNLPVLTKFWYLETLLNFNYIHIMDQGLFTFGLWEMFVSQPNF